MYLLSDGNRCHFAEDHRPARVISDWMVLIKHLKIKALQTEDSADRDQQDHATMTE